MPLYISIHADDILENADTPFEPRLLEADSAEEAARLSHEIDADLHDEDGEDADFSEETAIISVSVVAKALRADGYDVSITKDGKEVA